MPLLEIDAVAPVQGRRLNTRVKTTKGIAEKVASARKAVVEAGGLPANYIVCNDVRDLGQIAREISTHRKFDFDTETSGLNAWRDEIYCVSIWVNGKSYLINFAHPLLPQIDISVFRQQLGSYFSDDSIVKRSFNLSFDAHFIEEQAGIPFGYLHYDPGVAMWLLDENYMGVKGSGRLKAICERFLNFEAGGSYDEQFGKTAWIVIDPLVASYYACKDAELHYRLAEWTEAELKKVPALYKLAHDLEMPVQNILYETEREGIPIDETEIASIAASLTEDIDALCNEMNALVLAQGHVPPTWSKEDDVNAYLFDTLHLRKVKGMSVDREVLAELQEDHPVIPLLMKWRKKYKLKTAFIDALPQFIIDGKIHCQFRVTGSKTGRGSCNNPNLYQMPTKGEGMRVRNAFLAPEGTFYVSKDYSGQELRLQAGMSNDQALIDVIINDKDFYSVCTAIFFGGTDADYTKHGKGQKERDLGKRAVLAMSYGAMAAKLASIFKSTRDKAQDFIDGFNRKFYGLANFHKQNIKKCKRVGYVETILGRRRHLDYNAPGLQKFDEFALDRQVANSPIQGSAADQIKLAMRECDRHFKRKGYKARVLFPIHDEILFRIPQDELLETMILQEIDQIMVSVLNLPIPFTTSTEIYRRWGKIHYFLTTPFLDEEESE
ncbi:MAG: DNA polymerase [Minisyncoccia bacterium]